MEQDVAATPTNQTQQTEQAPQAPSTQQTGPLDLSQFGGVVVKPQPTEPADKPLDLSRFDAGAPQPVKPLDLSQFGGVVVQSTPTDPERDATIRHLRSRGITNPTEDQINSAMGAQHEGSANPNLQTPWESVKQGLTTPLAKPEQIIPGYGLIMAGASGLHDYLKAHDHPELANVVAAYKGTEGGLGDMAAANTSPMNAAILLATGGLGAAEELPSQLALKMGMSPRVIAAASKFIPTIQKLLDAGFTGQMLMAAYNNIPDIKDSLESGDVEGSARLMTELLGHLFMAGMAAHGAVQGPVAETLSTAKEKVGDVWANRPKVLGGPGQTAAQALDIMTPRSAREQIKLNEAMRNADPQLRDLAQKNPNLQKTGTPQDYIDLINERIEDIEGDLRGQARALQSKGQSGGPAKASILEGAQEDLTQALDEHFKEIQGAFSPAEVKAAKKAAVDRMMQEEGEEVREPSLFEAENLRRQLGKENKPIYGDNSKPTAEREALATLESFLRDKIYDQYEKLGVPDVDKWRKQESGLIDVRNHMERVVKKAENTPDFNILQSAFNRSGWGVLGLLLGHGWTGALALEGLGMAKDYARDVATNPNRAARTYAKRAATEPSTPAAIPGRAPKPTPSPQNELDFERPLPSPQHVLTFDGEGMGDVDNP